ncbi:MAG: SCO family protein [Candidatus Marinimicrobia bacterium]|nr:SCO family protein [Candidatus Neomarinimicrobiota bacterium]MBT3496273.1 SCO family protein [Candidatus Neomarinimicrobiota bacterium]MBT3691610.1 SCO family protein [Candidatus Neomarinimicrobiota bacterium]MBT3732358.1 SCO family protein [Candidatus Neomarinimicrobiota bacterium]MBT4144934.1 SCO family protein [Candidatus Neomarinimicrobiota bacterium]
MKKETIILSVLMVLGLMIIGATWVVRQATEAQTIPVLHSVPNFVATSHVNQPFTEQDLLGKITIADFMFTQCTGPCPTMSSNMKSLYEQYAKIKDVQFISFTVDPNHDHIDVLSAYADAHGVKDERWLFLRSETPKVAALSQDGFKLYAKELPVGHAIKFVLIDEKGRIRQYYDGLEKASMAILQSHINRLLKDLKS